MQERLSILFASLSADSQLRKGNDRVVAALNSAHSGFDPIAEMRNSFQCRPEASAAPSDRCAETELLELASSENESEAIAARMKQHSWTRAVVVRISFYFFKDEDFMARALVLSFENGQEIPKVPFAETSDAAFRAEAENGSQKP